MCTSVSKHDQYVEELKHHLTGRYDQILTNVVIYRRKRSKKRVVAEIDLLAKSGNKYHIYEVKCSYRVTKARMQLAKIRNKIDQRYKITKSFFYCGSSGLLVRL